MKYFNFFVILNSFLLFSMVASAQNNQWIHSYIRVDNHWDPTQERLRFKLCADSLIQNADVTTSLHINGNSYNSPSIYGGEISVTNPGDTITIIFSATHSPSSRAYTFHAQIVTDLIAPSIQYLTSPNNNQALPMSILTTKKNASSSSSGKSNLNISGGIPFPVATDLYAIRWKLNGTNVAGNFTDSLTNLQGGDLVKATFGDNWFQCASFGSNTCCDTINGVWVCDTLCFPTCNDLFFCYDETIDLLSCVADIHYDSYVNYQAIANFSQIDNVTLEVNGYSSSFGTVQGTSITIQETPSVCGSYFMDAVFYHYDGTDVTCVASKGEVDYLQVVCKANLTVQLDGNGEYLLNVSEVDNGSSFAGHPLVQFLPHLNQTYFTCVDTGMQSVVYKIDAECNGNIVMSQWCTTMVQVVPSANCNSSNASIVTLPDISPAFWSEGSSPLVTIPFEANGAFNLDNVFMAKISDATGDFSNATTIGSINSSSLGILSIQGAPIASLPAGTNYKVRVVSTSPPVIGTEIGVVINKNVGLDETFNEQFLIFPNPASTYFSVENKGENKIMNVELLDMKGRVLQKYMFNELGYYSLENIATGMYFIKIIVNEKIFVQKVIVK